MSKTTKQQSSASGAAVEDDPGPRQDYLKDSDYFMAVALLAAERSRDPNTQVGACIVNQENQIVGIGHNIMPNGCDGQLSWKGSPENSTDIGDLCRKSDYQRKESKVQRSGIKYPYECHAERHAIMNKNFVDVKRCTMYVTLPPCDKCAKLIIEAGIRTVIYLSEGDGRKETIASERLLKKAGIRPRPFEGAGNPITLNFS